MLPASTSTHEIAIFSGFLSGSLPQKDGYGRVMGAGSGERSPLDRGPKKGQAPGAVAPRASAGACAGFLPRASRASPARQPAPLSVPFAGVRGTGGDCTAAAGVLRGRSTWWAWGSRGGQPAQGRGEDHSAAAPPRSGASVVGDLEINTARPDGKPLQLAAWSPSSSSRRASTRASTRSRSSSQRPSTHAAASSRAGAGSG